MTCPDCKTNNVSTHIYENDRGNWFRVTKCHECKQTFEVKI